MAFVHLHVHSHYSLLDGLPKIKELIAKAKEYHQEALALTDHGVMYGAVEFYQQAKAAGLKPIIGCEIYLAPGGYKNKRARIDDLRYHLVLLAKNLTGYKNLLQITSEAHLAGFYYKPRVDLDFLRTHAQGLIALSACNSGEIPKTILAGDRTRVIAAIKKYQTIFGPDNFYLEVQHNPKIPDQAKVNAMIFQLAGELNLPVVATADIHYLNPEDAEAQDVLLCLQSKDKLTNKERWTMLPEEFYYYSPSQMEQFFADHPEAVANTAKVAARCNLELELNKIRLPNFPVPTEQTADDYLRSLCLLGLAKKTINPTNSATYQARMNYELSVIQKMGFAPYFLIVADFVNWAKKQNIVVGPGRGSAAGSLVAYLTSVTDIDPLEYNLLFERFLNPERISMPDIDLDFADNRRDEVIRYVEKKYGRDHVAQIITFGTMAARAAIRDVGRVMDLPYLFCDQLAKMVPMFTTLDQALELSPEFKAKYQTDPQAKRLITTARKLEGVARHASVHACGVIITNEPLTDLVPLQLSSQNPEATISQYEMHAIETLGILKIDFLGLRNLTIIQNAIEVIDKIHQQKIDISQIPLTDKKTFRLLQQGETTGVFQLESSGMKRYLKQLKPTDFEDLIAMVSLYRPGPMELIPSYIKRKHGQEKIVYLHPKLEPILKNTYGIAVYQEQLMRMAQDLAGLSLPEADTLRKAIGKKISVLLDQQRIKFIQGCQKNGLTKELGEKLFSFIEPFARYGFNRSHAACYALIGYRTAYLKAHYPAEFMASLLTSDQNDTDRIAIEVNECRQMGILVLPPDINESFSTFTVVAESLKSDKNTRIRFGLLAVKNMGQNIVKEIIQERRDHGNYQSLANLLQRISHKDLNKKSLESLAKSGALDSLIERNQVLTNIDLILSYEKSVQRAKDSHQSSLFGAQAGLNLPQLNLPPTEPASLAQKLNWEKELLGLYVTSHPLNELGELPAEVTPLKNLAQKLNQKIIILGVVTNSQKKITRNNELMMFVRIEDPLTSAEVLVFPKILAKQPQLFLENNILAIIGRASDKDGVPKIIVDQAVAVTKASLAAQIKTLAKQLKNNGQAKNYYQAYSYQPETPPQAMVQDNLKLTLPATSKKEIFNQIKDILSQYPGEQRVELNLVQSNGTKRTILTSAKVKKTPELLASLQTICGPEAIIF